MWRDRQNVIWSILFKYFKNGLIQPFRAEGSFWSARKSVRGGKEAGLGGGGELGGSDITEANGGSVAVSSLRLVS